MVVYNLPGGSIKRRACIVVVVVGFVIVPSKVCLCFFAHVLNLFRKHETIFKLFPLKFDSFLSYETGYKTGFR